MAKRKMKKSEKKKIAKQKEKLREKLFAFLQDYGDIEEPQEPDTAAADRQLQSIMTLLSSEIVQYSEGSIIDVGCGKGALLSRVSELPAFKENELWNYVGIDFEELSNEIFHQAIELGIHRRIDFFNLENFYQNWPNRNKYPEPHIVVVRNVFHELDIGKTAFLLTHLSTNMQINELAIIQDLAVFPKAEKGHACWIPKIFSELILTCGFIISMTPERSSSGNWWFNLISRRNKDEVIELQDVKKAVLKARNEQLEHWKSKGALLQNHEQFREVQIEKIDFDLQFAALTLQLQKAGATIPNLSAKEESLIHRATFSKHLNNFKLFLPKNKNLSLKFSGHFRDRKNSLDALIKFFLSNHYVVLIAGPPLMGKSELIRHFLCSDDFEQNRLPIFVDLHTTSGGWNLLDQILSEMGCTVPNDILLSMSNIKLEDLSKQLKSFFQRYGSQLVVVIDHLERITDPSNIIADSEIQSLLLILAQSKVKLILTSRKHETDLTFLPSVLMHPIKQPIVGRFPRKDHVENVLQSFVLQEKYPDKLLQAIDHHPFLTTLTGMYLQQKGTVAFDDNEFMGDLHYQLKDAIFSKILTPNAKLAVEAISKLRVPVPRDMIQALSSADSLEASESIGVIRQHLGGMRDDLVSCIGALKVSVWDMPSDELNSNIDENKNSLPPLSEKDFHEKIAMLYEQLYRDDDNPIWLREAHFHRMVFSTKDELNIFGKRYRTELFAAGEYWYDHDKDFDKALWAYERALQYGQAGYKILMRIASCKLRIAKTHREMKEARKKFDSLVARFPQEYGIRTAYIDAVLYKKDFSLTIYLLKKLDLKQVESWWVAGQYGRAYSGLNEHHKAIVSFERQLLEKPEAVVYENIARAYHRLGDTENEVKKITQGLTKYQRNKRLLLYRGIILERIGPLDEAVKTLTKLLKENPENGWIIFPYIRALARSNKLDDAIAYWKKYRFKIRPDYLRVPIEADLLIRQNRHEDAISLLKTLPEDEHSIGQLLEAYLDWANSQNEIKEKKRIAVEGLSIPLDNITIKNIPVLITKSKLSIVADNKNVSIETIDLIEEINPNVKELNRIYQDYCTNWREDCC